MRPLATRAVYALALFAVLSGSVRASADAVTGTLTGSVGVRGNYYLEKSTRVIAPAVTATMATPRGVRMDATYLLDAITSASLATGVTSDQAFTEKRHDFQGGAGYEVDLGGVQLDLVLRGRMSREPDYKSRGVGFASTLSLNERNTVLRFNGYFLHDDVARVDRQAPINDRNALRASPAVPVGELDTVSLGFAVDQLLSPLATLTLGYDLGILNGFTANAYRKVIFQDGGVGPETHPDLRRRHAAYGWLAHYVPRTRSSLRVGYRIYKDDWEVLAHAPELRIYQELGSYVELRLRYRYYTQSESFFWRRGGNLKTDLYVTADPKMSPFQDQTFGLKLRLGLDFLRGTWLRALRTAVIDGSLEYMINTNRYGDAWISQAGLLWAF